MKCISCGAHTSFGATTDVTDLGDCLIIIRNVPCFKCSECSEVIYTAEVVKRLEDILNAAKLINNEISVIDYNSKVA